jgi:GT2 family glycosyltransferase
MSHAEIEASLTIVVINYRTAPLVRSLVDELPDWATVVVVDNFTTQTEQEAVSRISTARIILSPNNAGFFGGVNRALAEIDDSDWVLLLNPDASIDERSLRTLLRRAIDESIDLTSPVILNARSDRTWFTGGYIRRRTGDVRHFRIGEPFHPQSRTERSEFISGCVMLMSPLARKLLTPLPESYFLYYEDAQLSVEASRLGLRRAVVLDAIARHIEGVSSNADANGRSATSYYYQSRNRLLFIRQNWEFPTASGVLATPRRAVRDVARILFRERSARFSKIASVLVGIRDGIVGKDGPRC